MDAVWEIAITRFVCTALKFLITDVEAQRVWASIRLFGVAGNLLALEGPAFSAVLRLALLV